MKSKQIIRSPTLRVQVAVNAVKASSDSGPADLCGTMRADARGYGLPPLRGWYALPHVDSMFDIRFQAHCHVRPTRAVVVRSLETRLVGEPTTLADA